MAKTVAKPITILGVFVADLAFRIQSLPKWGETVLGSDFRIGPGGKGSNQAVAAARLGGNVTFISKVGRDAFSAIARQTYAEAGVNPEFMVESPDHPTGAAAIILDRASGENAVIIMPEAAALLTAEEVDRAQSRIAESAIFMTNLEIPVPLVEHGLALAHRAGVPTILNPAPACALPDSIFQLCDYLTPNETEAAILTGVPVESLDEAERAAAALLERGVRNAVITLGARGVLVKNSKLTEHIPAVNAGPVVETTGAGDAFNGGFAVGLSEGMDIVEAARFGCATAGISVTRHGTAPSMPTRREVEALMA